jgi:hypothetical protein
LRGKHEEREQRADDDRHDARDVRPFVALEERRLRGVDDLVLVRPISGSATLATARFRFATARRG